MAKWQDPIVFAIWLGIIILVFLALVFSIIVFTSLYFRRILKEKEKLSETQLNHQKNLAQSSVLTQEKERSRVAGELHDGLVSRLNVLNMALRMGSKKIDPLAILDECIVTARGISHDLHPPMLEQLGLTELIKGFIDPLKENFEIKFHERIYNNAVQKENDTKLQLLRMVQEIISNIIKHAEATTISIHIRMSFKHTSIIITDNGKGFNVAEQGQGLGMKNIELRCQFLNGKFKMKSELGKGSTFIFNLAENIENRPNDE